MPYYLYRVTPVGPVRHLQALADFAAFKEASAEAKRLRLLEPDPTHIRMMFADNRLMAEETLSTVRAAEPMIGEDY